MRYACPLFVVVVLCALLCVGCSGCAKIDLSKPGGGGNSQAATGGGANNSGLPPLNGDWTLSFEYNDQLFESAVTFSQAGSQIAGQGEDQAGPFYIQNGVLNGSEIKFAKKYANVDPTKAPINYVGKYEWVDIPDYKGWQIGGRYTTTSNGKPVEGKWIATPAVQPPPPPGAVVEQAPPPQTVQQAPPQQQAPPEQMPTGQAPNLSGMYTVNYQYNFKPMQSKMWLEQDGGQIRGHGVDTNTNEHFTIKGWYNPAEMKMTIVRQYTKGKSAAATRQMTFKSSVMPGPSFKGETNFGGSWEGKIVR
jgi:hypothetical protein